MAELAPVDVKELIKTIQSLGKAGDVLEPTMSVAAEMLVSEVQDRWRSAGDGQWPPLAPSTLAHRRSGKKSKGKKGGGKGSATKAQILMDTGRAFGSVQAFHGPDFAQAASDVDYMKYHCGDGPRTKIPKRDPFEISDEAEERVMEFVLADIVARWTATPKA